MIAAVSLSLMLRFMGVFRLCVVCGVVWCGVWDYIPLRTAFNALIASKIFSEYSVEKSFSQRSFVSDWIWLSICSIIVVVPLVCRLCESSIG